MKITFNGASGEVTGSCYLLETARAKVLIDFGQHQGERGSREKNEQPTPFDPGTLDAVVATHAHIDHIGLMPRLTSRGFDGPVYATPATIDLAEIMLHDAARLQEADAARDQRRAPRFGREPMRPLFTEEDVKRFLPHFRPMQTGQWVQVADGVRVKPFDSGHILGSVSLEVQVTDGGSTQTIVFSGDIGPSGVPLLHDPTPPVTEKPADFVVMESTYGDRDHRPIDATLDEAEKVLHDAIWNKSKVLIPAFAVGRTQLVLYYLAKLARSGRVPRFPIYLDSPMAVSAMKLYAKYASTLDAQASEVVTQGDSSFDVPGLTCTESAEQSKALNDIQGAAVIIAGSGMCNGGRILHHLKHNVWKRDCHVLIIGYQAEGTIGRDLVERRDSIRIFGDDIIVRAKIHTLGGFSAHAGRSDLLKWAGTLAPTPGKQWPRMALTHGEDTARQSLATEMNRLWNFTPTLPREGDSIEL
ncbi:MAG: MBL fold metallo-hydrolase [Phycisphaerales bacterium]